jgi:tRNA(adenine34) deaminase
MQQDSKWMMEALVEADVAFENGEVPIGAVVVLEGEVVGRGHNRTEKTGYPFEHAEVVALWDAVGKVGAHRLTESVLYSTVEPCVMCIGAAILARVPRVVFGAHEPRTGACESILSIPNEPDLPHRMVVTGGVEAERCKELMQAFFADRRRDTKSD